MSSLYETLLIDDSKPVSFFNKVILERSQLFYKVEISVNGKDALKLLNEGFSPDIIFLDLNMPVMNGWEFLEEYTKLTHDLCPIVLLLGTELSDTDKNRLTEYPLVKGVRPKMLSVDALNEIKRNILQTKF